MEISDYDEYIPERELNKNFTIPRKRTAEDSFGPSPKSAPPPMRYNPLETTMPAYGYANPRASRYTDSRPGMPSFNTLSKPSVVPQINSYGNTQYTKSSNPGFIEYPKRTAMSNTNANEFNKTNSSNSGNWAGGARKNSDSPLWDRRESLGGKQVYSEKPLGWNNQSSGNYIRNSGLGNNYGNDWKGNNYSSLGNNVTGLAHTGHRDSSYSDSGCADQNKNNYSSSGCVGQNGNNNSRLGYLGQKQMDFGHENYTSQGSYHDGPKNNMQKNTGRYWNKPDRPKIPKVQIPPVTISDVKDESLPKELREMFQPLFCKLCSLQMTSNVMAKMHYVSKNHEKKIRKFLIEYSQKTGEPLHPRATVTNAEKKEKEEDKDPRNFYCEICDLQLTGKKHAECHYMGKSHNAVRMGKKRPAGKGYFDPSGKWIRISKEGKVVLTDGEDTFGADFKPKPEEAPVPKAVEVISKPKPKMGEQFFCSLCIVSCVSQEQLNIHLSGSKHKKKLRLKGLSPENFILPKDDCQEQFVSNSIPVSENLNASNESDEIRSKHITPNGHYYCEKCNITVNSVAQFKQHLSSKNHAKNANKKPE